MIRTVGARLPGLMLSKPVLPAFRYASTTPSKRKVPKSGDISQVPLNFIGVMADFYIPPRFRDCPPSSWHKLIFRRLGAFVVNTYSIIKYRRETGLKLHFNEWKDNAIDLFVKTNKIFASGCSKRFAEREQYLKKQLGQVSCVEVTNSLVSRAKTFPTDSKLQWELLSLESNPKVVSFNVLPDANEITMYIQFVLKARTKQKVIIERGGESQETVRTVQDYLVYTLNPYTGEMYLAGTLFESDHIRKVTPDEKFTNVKYMMAFTKASGDIYRENPKKIGSN
ncbi:uncharacterized protein CANTADRAFT_26247, partial [Suhomyces tanzawaensis NRRL Y-17324]